MLWNATTNSIFKLGFLIRLNFTKLNVKGDLGRGQEYLKMSDWSVLFQSWSLNDKFSILVGATVQLIEDYL